LIIDELLPRAKTFVAEGEQRLAALEARVADLQRKGHDALQSKKLLAVMRETMSLQINHVELMGLQINHVELLEREVQADPGFEPT
jgi:hypothetical protein